MALSAVGSTGAKVTLVPRPFETEMLNMPVAYLEIEGGETPDAGSIAAALADAARKGTRLVACRRQESETATLRELQAAGFREIERLVTLERDLNDVDRCAPARVRLARKADADAIAAIGATAFRYDRFHADPQVSNAAADRLKAAWAHNSVNGRADAVFVSEDGGRITGFNACLLRGDGAVIDLIGVDEGAQRRGFGGALVMASLAHYTGKVACMSVGTQSTNLPSLALYETASFRRKSTAVTLHLHLN